jgi:hypothetical protein
MHSNLDRSSPGKALIVLVCGVLATIAGGIGLKIIWPLFDYVLSEYNRSDSPFTFASTIYQGVWLLVALCTLIAGLSLIFSALRRKENDLIPGPTLYFLGLGLAVIGGFLIMSGLSWQAVALIGGGFFLIYWEWAYHVS